MPTTPMRALSIRQPWAALILAGHKPVENRTWTTRYRGPLILHAGKGRMDLSALALADLLGLADFPRGAYLGVAELIDVHHASACGGCHALAVPGAWHWKLADPRPLAEPIPGPGRLGLFTPSESVLAAVVAAVEEIA